VDVSSHPNAKGLKAFFEGIHTLFATVPYRVTAKKEAYFHGIMHIVPMLTGRRVFSEVATNRGRMDTVPENGDTVFIFEFKVRGRAEDALAQVHALDYPERFAKTGKQLILIGASYDMEARDVREWKVVQVFFSRTFAEPIVAH